MDPPTKPQPAASPSDEKSITLDSVVVVAKEQISCDLLGESVILDLCGGVYYGLDEVGARVWALMQVPRTVGDVCEALLEEYEVDPQRCEIDLLNLLGELRAKDLIEITE